MYVLCRRRSSIVEVVGAEAGRLLYIGCLGMDEEVDS